MAMRAGMAPAAAGQWVRRAFTRKPRSGDTGLPPGAGPQLHMAWGGFCPSVTQACGCCSQQGAGELRTSQHLPAFLLHSPDS